MCLKPFSEVSRTSFVFSSFPMVFTRSSSLTSDGASYFKPFTLLLLLHLTKRPTTQRALSSTCTLALVFRVQDSMVMGTKKWQGSVMRESLESMVWEVDKTCIGGGNVSKAQNTYSHISRLEFVDKIKGEERQKNMWTTMKQ
jgi:hypothetical protein